MEPERSHRSRQSPHGERDSNGRPGGESRHHRREKDEYRSRRRDENRERSSERRRHRSRSPDRKRRRSGSRDRDEDKSYRRRSPRDDAERERHKHRGHRARDDDTDRNKDKQALQRGGPLPSQEDSFALTNGEEPPKPKEKPNFGTSGALAAASNSIVQTDGSTIVLKYHEPPEARKPSPRDQWKLFVFKGDEIIDTIELNHRSCWLVGREMAIVDLAAEHPSISKQHAVIQFRYLEKRNEFGDKIGKVKPYLIDLESANGTKLNSKKVPESRYLELKDKDLVQFGQSTREYVIMLAPKD